MYKNLNDSPVLLPGPTQIWYMRPEYFPQGIAEMGGVDTNDLTKTHILLGTIDTTSKERVYSLMQGESWSPNGEASELIKSKGLRHTSMSVGDVVVINGQIFQVSLLGFIQLN